MILELLWFIAEVFWIFVAVKFTVYDLESIWHCIVITLQCSERCQNLVIDAFNKRDFVKWVVAMDLVAIFAFLILRRREVI